MEITKRTELRNQDSRDLDRLLAKFELERQNRNLQEVITNHPEQLTTDVKDILAKRVLKAEISDVTVNWFSIIIGGTLDCDFETGVAFHGSFGGVGLGGGTDYGTAAFNYGVVWLADQKWRSRFVISAGGAGLIIHFWGMSNEYIGSIVAKDYKGNEVLVAGEGSFFRK